MELEFSSDILTILLTTGLTIYCFGWILLKLSQRMPFTGQVAVYYKGFITKIIPTGHVLFCTSFRLQQHVTTVIKRKDAPACDDETDHVSSLNLFIQHIEGGNTKYEDVKTPYAHFI